LWGVFKLMHASAEPDHSESDDTEPNQDKHHQTCLVRSALFWDIMQPRVETVVGQPTGPNFKGQNIQKTKHSMTEVKWHSLIFWNIVYRLIF
jgi:hypothetical protein